MEAAGAEGSGAAVFHPPKSSSGVILGGPLVPPPDPKPDEALAPPQLEKPLLLLGTVLDLSLTSDLEAAEGSEEAHASFEPQASSVEKPENAVELTGARGVDLRGGWDGVDKLNTKLVFEEGSEGFEGFEEAST